jgi:hypothetical protein
MFIPAIDKCLGFEVSKHLHADNRVDKEEYEHYVHH